MTDIEQKAQEVAEEIIKRVRAQNWKLGGVLTMDTDEAEALIEAALLAFRRIR